MTAVTAIPSTWPKGFKTHEEVLAERLASDSEFAAEWERLALARMVAVQLIGFRADHGLSQRELAERLGVSQPRVVELESGEKNPQIETLVKSEPKLVGKAVKDTPAHVYAGASLLVAGA